MARYKIKIVDPNDASKFATVIETDIWPQPGDILPLKGHRARVSSVTNVNDIEAIVRVMSTRAIRAS